MRRIVQLLSPVGRFDSTPFPDGMLVFLQSRQSITGTRMSNANTSSIALEYIQMLTESDKFVPLLVFVNGMMTTKDEGSGLDRWTQLFCRNAPYATPHPTLFGVLMCDISEHHPSTMPSTTWWQRFVVLKSTQL